MLITIKPSIAKVCMNIMGCMASNTSLWTIPSTVLDTAVCWQAGCSLRRETFWTDGYRECLTITMVALGFQDGECSGELAACIRWGNLLVACIAPVTDNLSVSLKETKLNHL